MQRWLDDNNILMYFRSNESKSVITQKFIKKLKAALFKKITVNDSNSYLGYLNKLVN